jgi:hypothetical protein
MAFRIKTKSFDCLTECVPAKELFERVRCTVLDIVFPFYSFSKKIRMFLNQRSLHVIFWYKK